MMIDPFKNQKTEPLKLYEDRLKDIVERDDYIVALVTATKPDFYKQWSLIPAAEKHDVPLFVMNTGQHHDDLLGHGLSEFNIEDKFAVNLNIRGDLSQKTAELMVKIKWFADYLKKNYPKKTILPVVHGDTQAAGIVPLAWMFATNRMCAQNEAGLRSMSPDFGNHKDIGKFIDDQFDKPWSINRSEPFPEQYDTFVSAAASHYLFAPTELNAEHLVREGYSKKNVYTVGNSVVDAVAFKKKEKSEESVFDVYPALEEHDDWIRVDIHRRANLLPGRFRAIMQGVIKLVDAGYNVNLINMNATRVALENYGLLQKMKELEKSHKNFLFTGLWPVYGHVIEFLESGKCFCEFTDSGSMQEELNEIQGPLCLTARYNTDRPETVMDAKTNVLVPPVSGDYVYRFIEHVRKDEELRKRLQGGRKLYGKDVGEKIIKIIKKSREFPFEWAHDVVGVKQDDKCEFDFL